ncbi:MAG: cobalt-precorrin-4 C(11)-methyltransferase, partial [Lachnospiraceae bacterium]|nr:cobalt-precorrin-4 C(11)-methyltransferase [Lachnospiraceae bacterium]
MNEIKVHFVGAGPGAKDLITVRGKELLERADVIIFAGSLVNPALLEYAKAGCVVLDSARMHLEEVINAIVQAAKSGKEVARLHSGEPSLYGAVREQMDALDEKGILYDSCPGV